MTHRPKREFSIKVKILFIEVYEYQFKFILLSSSRTYSQLSSTMERNCQSSATDAWILLSHAVDVIPLSVELWFALDRLEVPERAKAALNKARKAVPTSHEIWIAAGRLLEQEASLPTKIPAERAKGLEVVDKTIEAGARELRRHQVLLTREQWLKEAERCGDEGSPRTCETIVKATVAME
jgi:pre-mRNA-processing factor 6